MVPMNTPMAIKAPTAHPTQRLRLPMVFPALNGQQTI